MPHGLIEPALQDVAASVRLLRRSVRPEPGGPPLNLDLGGVIALSAAGAGELVALHNRLGDSGGRLVLWNVGPAAYQVLAVAGLTRLLDVRRPPGEKTMELKKMTRERREAELQALIRTPDGRAELEAIANRYRAAGGSMRPANTSVITYILVHERAAGRIDG